MNQVTKRQPLIKGLSELQHTLDRMFEPSWMNREDWLSNVVDSNWAPTVDIKDKPDQYLIRADVPGVDPKNIDVTIEQGILTIKGHKEETKKEGKEDGTYLHVERSQGYFYRSFNLPNAADSSKITAKSKNGVLEIIVPKAQEALSHKIKIDEE